VERAGKGYVLCSIGEESGEIPYTAFFAAKSFLSGQPETVQGFTNAIARAQKWIQETEAAEIAKVIAPQFPDSDLEVLTAVTQRHKDIDAWNSEPFMKKEALERLETVMETAGELSEWVDYDALVDMSFALKAVG